MNNSPNVSNDARYLQLTSELRHLQNEKEKTRPALYLLLTIILGFIGIVLLPYIFSFCILLFAVASLLATATAFIKSIMISNQIEETKAKIQKLEFSVTSVPTATSTSTSIESKLSALQILLEKNLITKEEYEAKKTELLQRL